jgi:xanthine dehydrogenase accessory factor
MHTQDWQVLDALERWHSGGHRAALVTVTKTWGSAPRPAGAWMALRDDGLVQGSVSGGCIEDDLIARMRSGEFSAQEAGRTRMPLIRRYGVTADEAARFGLPCGGTLELVIEPAPDMTQLRALAARLESGELCRRELSVLTGAVSLSAAERGETLTWDGVRLCTIHGPRWRLLIIGAGQIARYLATMAQALDFTVLVCDPRAEYAVEWGVPGATLQAGMPDEVVLAMRPDAHTAIVALTHDRKLDDMALLEALKSGAFYVGALGSRVNNEARRLRLLEHFDLSVGEIARLRGPAGLYIGSHTPPEIALSILAEITAVKNGVNPTDRG